MGSFLKNGLSAIPGVGTALGIAKVASPLIGGLVSGDPMSLLGSAGNAGGSLLDTLKGLNASGGTPPSPPSELPGFHLINPSSFNFQQPGSS